MKIEDVEKTGDAIMDALSALVAGGRKEHREEILGFLTALHEISERLVETIDLPDAEFFNAHREKETAE